jgi:hypothetical protein
MENHHFQWVNPLSMAMFNSFLYVYQRVLFANGGRHTSLSTEQWNICATGGKTRLIKGGPASCTSWFWGLGDGDTVQFFITKGDSTNSQSTSVMMSMMSHV